MDAARWMLGIASLFVLCAVLPWAVACLAVPELERSGASRVVNYRRRPVVLGLGAVWLVWGGGALLGGWLLSDLGFPAIVCKALAVAGLLAIAAGAFGLVDDAYGSRETRGFSGHITALASGRLTTGGLKLIGIGIASLAAARAVSDVAAWGSSPVGVLVGGAAVALTANLINLLDLRPGRALKAYVVAGLPAAALLAVAVPQASGDGVLTWLLLALALLGPAIACWRYDLGERAMLGDAGANAMGAVLGLVLIIAMPMPRLLAFAALLAALNLASERVSFSALIERVPALAWLDGLGRGDGRAQAGDRSPHDDRSSRYDGTDGEDSGFREV